MSSLRPFHPLDLLRFNLTNLDPLTETYDISFYLSYLAKWPSLFTVVEGVDGRVEAYIMGKLESSPAHLQHSEHYLPYHAHITALTVSPPLRRLGLARLLTASLERAGDEYDAWFVDLFVRKSNGKAVGMYRGWGYSVFRRVVGYYSDSPIGGGGGGGEGKGKERRKKGEEGEDAYDMRKPLKRDTERRHVREGGEEWEVRPEDVW